MIDRIKTSPATSAHRRLRIGAVSYLNSKPLIEGLAASVPQADVVLDFPSRLADDLASGWLDVALIPSVESLSDPDYEIVSDACVAARGPVMSVKLYFRVSPGNVRSLALDAGSRTSAALSRVLLAERFGVEPQLLPLPLGAKTTDVQADAVLLIGDRAMHPPREQFRDAWDLGEEWYRWTGLPFVFAMWVTREGVDLGHVDSALSAARDTGVARMREIAMREAPNLNLTEAAIHHYLKYNLHFQLGSAERSGFKLFQRLASGLGLAPSRALPDFRPVQSRPNSVRRIAIHA
ncbi:MAG: menaquinone biosynthetic enzyme MqnA/MqnD family protein [Planctomycetaceae bacterium]